MKIDNWKLAQAVRWGFYIIFLTFSVVGGVSVLMGYTQHIITTIGSIAMTYAVGKHW